MKVMVFQSEISELVPLDYVGTVRYEGESFGVDSLTDGKEYTVVRDESGMLKIVDDSEEDYLYDLLNPRPLDGSSKGGSFVVLDDPAGEIKQEMTKGIADLIP